MKTATQQIQDLITITQHQNQQYKTGLSRKYQLQLTALLRKIRDIIRVDYDSENTTKKAQIALQKKIDTELKNGLEKIQKDIDSDLQDFMKMNNKLYQDQLIAVFQPVQDFLQIKKVKDSDIINGYNKDPMTFEKSGNHTVSSLYKTFTTRLNTIIKQTVNQAYTLEESTRDFESDIYGITANTNVSKGNLDAVIGSLIAHGFSSVLRYVNKNNLGVFSGYSWDSVIDTATSEICQDFNMRFYIYDAPEKSTLPYEIYPPAHHRCRSTTSAITKTYTELGIDPTELTEEQRQLLGKPDLTPFSYTEFVESQPLAVQKELLGAVRYDMYKKGEIEISQFYTRDGRKLSLYELQKKGYDISKEYLHFVRNS